MYTVNYHSPGNDGFILIPLQMPTDQVVELYCLFTFFYKWSVFARILLLH